MRHIEAADKRGVLVKLSVDSTVESLPFTTEARIGIREQITNIEKVDRHMSGIDNALHVDRRVRHLSDPEKADVIRPVHGIGATDIFESVLRRGVRQKHPIKSQDPER